MELTQNVKNIQEKWDANFMKTYAQIPVVMDKGEGAPLFYIFIFLFIM